MDTPLLKLKIEEARQRLTIAEQELESGMLTLTRAQGGEKTVIAKLLESAFSKLKEAKRHLVDLTDLLVDEVIAPRADQRDCPACHKSIMAAATLCGFCWTRLA